MVWSPPSPRGLLGKFPCPGTHTATLQKEQHWDVVCYRQTGTQRKPSPLWSHCSGGVNLSGICWESGGNLLGPLVFIGWFIPRWAKRTSSPCTPLQHHPAPAPWRCSDDKTIPCLSVLLNLEMSVSALSSRLHSLSVLLNWRLRPRQILNMPLVMLAWGCLETFHHKLWWPQGLRAARGQPTIKRKQQLK